MARRQSFGPYELAERIGVGALGEVFRAVRRADGKVVALKRLLASSESEHDVVETLEAEAKLLGALDHDAIARLDEFGQASGVHFIAYEFVDGRDLRAVQERALRGDGKAPPARVPLDVALFVAIRIADALAHAHDRTDARGAPLGLVHRDVSPPNIMVGFDGSVKLLDFGIARAAGRAEHTAAGQVKGTMGYMSPEQVQGDAIDARSDVYTLAVCLWELATGRRLFDGRRTFEVAAQIKKGEVPSARRVAARVSERLDAALAKALAQQPDQRYAGAREFRDELTALARVEDLVADSTRVAQYVRSLFPEVAAESAASREEPQNMADDKGGSDLDVFEGLAKKSQRPASLPGLAPPASAPPRKATLVGGLAPVPLPPPGSASKAPPPPGSLPPPSLPKPP
ncbi:MAG TPA: serine/threonine-protein kinase, partial [Byssovorax sp.]